MAELKTAKSKGRALATAEPPPREKAPGNVKAPERVVSEPVSTAKPKDGRSLRKTGRLHQFATRLTLERAHQIREIAERDRILIAELIELAIDAYEHQRSRVDGGRGFISYLADIKQRDGFKSEAEVLKALRDAYEEKRATGR